MQTTSIATNDSNSADSLLRLEQVMSVTSLCYCTPNDDGWAQLHLHPRRGWLGSYLSSKVYLQPLRRRRRPDSMTTSVFMGTDPNPGMSSNLET
jgi:hypothetical protein